MSQGTRSFYLEPIHIDVARNASDDFNLFHDKSHWHEIEQNPFGGPIALGFQLVCFIEDQMNHFRAEHNELALLDQQGLLCSNYSLNFAGVVKPGDQLHFTAKPSRYSEAEKILNNRVLIKGPRGLVLVGFKSESARPQFLLTASLPEDLILEQQADRATIPGTDFFYKRKFTTNSNAKNFLAASNVEQSEYFDEVNNKIRFSESYCMGMISCALLERGIAHQHDFKKNPMIYTSLRISVFRERVMALRSDQKLHLLVSPPFDHQDERKAGMVTYHCYGLNRDQEILFQGEIDLAPLAFILDAKASKAE